MDKNCLNQLISIRRDLHSNAELGFNLPHTKKIITTFLNEHKIECEEFCGGIVGVLGTNGPLVMVRADMDALPMKELSELPFSSTGNVAHCCGHDIHTTILLGTLAYLKDMNILRKIKILFVFQPDEEGGTGAKILIERGLFKKFGLPEYLLALHVDAKEPLGKLNYGSGKTFAGTDSLEIEVQGKGGHGARAFETKDPIFTLMCIYNELNLVISRKFNVFEHNILSITSLQAGNTYNIIPDNAKLLGTIRTYSNEERHRVLETVEKIASSVGKGLDNQVMVKFLNSVYPVITDAKLTARLIDHMRSKKIFTSISDTPTIKIGGEDYAFYADKIKKNSYVFIGAGNNKNEGYLIGQHNPHVIFNEKVIPFGISYFLETLQYLSDLQ